MQCLLILLMLYSLLHDQMLTCPMLDNALMYDRSLLASGNMFL